MLKMLRSRCYAYSPLPHAQSRIYHKTAYPKRAIEDVRVLLLSNSFNSMSQRAYLELTDRLKQDVRFEMAIDEKQMVDSVKKHNPHIILCPFLTKRIPDEIWKNKERLCLVVHPGIHGDRGASSIDWALKRKLPEWGVTVLQADEEMDAGDIWSTKNFPVPKKVTKSALYGSLVINTAMDCIHEAMEKFVSGQNGIPLDYSDPSVKGRLNDTMKLADRKIDFSLAAEDVESDIRFSDSAPGAPCTLLDNDVFAYDAYVDADKNNHAAQPGAITGKRHGAVRIACGDGSVWVNALKGRGKKTKLPRIKLPATSILPKDIIGSLPEIPGEGLFIESRITDFSANQLSATVSPAGVALIKFPFFNGAMSTGDCKRLTTVVQQANARSDVKVIVLAGRRSAWSYGINLNTIEGSYDPAQESWDNINAINDFVKAIFSSNKVTIAALQGNAGAGGAMAAMACDYVWAHEKTLLNPHYGCMGLHGSEYWTYFLPKRVGEKMAKELTDARIPVSAKTAQSLGIIDKIISFDKADFLNALTGESKSLADDECELREIMVAKKRERTPDWYSMVEKYRYQELLIMRENFVSEEYKKARKAFVH